MFDSMIDSRQLIYLPAWVKVVLVAVLAATLGAAIYIAISFIGVPEKSDWILLAVTGAQLAATVLIASLVLFFSQTDDSINALDKKADQFLKKVIPASLEKITAPNLGLGRLRVVTGGSRDVFGYNYILHDAEGFQLKIWIGLNVRRIFVIYFVSGEGPTTVADLQRIFRFTFGGAESVGFKANFEEGVVEDERIVSIWLTADATERLLTSPMDKLFWSQDVAMMTQSFLRTALRNKDLVNLATTCDPAPL